MLTLDTLPITAPAAAPTTDPASGELQDLFWIARLSVLNLHCHSKTNINTL